MGPRKFRAGGRSQPKKGLDPQRPPPGTSTARKNLTIQWPSGSMVVDGGGNTMKRLIIAALLVAGFSGTAQAFDAEGIYVAYATEIYTCSDYIDIYARTTLTDRNDAEAPSRGHQHYAYALGYLTAYNRYTPNKKQNIAGGDTINDIRRWLGSWCRDNSSQTLDNALNAYIRSQLKK